MINRAEIDKIICIGVSDNVEVNAYWSPFYESKQIIEIMTSGGRIALTLAQAEAAIDLLQEAMAHWREEGM